MEPSTALIYGDSGIGKTANLQMIADYLLSLYPGTKGRLITADGGGATPFLQTGLVDSGKVELLNIAASDLAYAEISALSEGKWPTTGATGSKTWYTKGASLKDVSFIMIEGLESFGQLLLSHMAHQNSGRAGFKLSWDFAEDLDGETYQVGGLDKGHYGIVQNELLRIHTRGFSQLPVQWIIWTSKVSRGEEDRTRETIYGPALVGKAKTSTLSGSFGDCLHLDTVQVDNREQRVAWFTRHLDRISNTPYIAKSRIALAATPYLWKLWPNGYVPLFYDKGLEQYFKFITRIPAMLAKKGNNANNPQDSSK
jgi:hypothetical protein